MATPNYFKNFSQRRGANVARSPTCCWIDGERPYGSDPWCNAVSVTDSSYCADHHARAWRPAPKKKVSGFVIEGRK